MQNKHRLALSATTAAAALLAIPLAASADTLTVEAVEIVPGKAPQPHSFSVELASDRKTEMRFGTDTKSFELKVFWDRKPRAANGNASADKRAPLVYSLEVSGVGGEKGRASRVTVSSATHLEQDKRVVIGRFTAPGGRELELALKVTKR